MVESSKEGYGYKMAVLPITMMIIFGRNKQSAYYTYYTESTLVIIMGKNNI
jgi:hypothetical protein